MTKYKILDIILLMKKENPIKANILKRLLGRKMVVIKDYIKNEYYYGQIEEVIDGTNVKVRNFNGETESISIFDLRSPSPDYP